MATKTSQNTAKTTPVEAVSRAEARAVQSLSWPDVWAEDLRLEVDAHPFNMQGREFQRAIIRDESKAIIVPKGAQLGFTTLFVLKSAHAVVVRHKSVLYLLPLKAGSISFVQSRVDPILASNKALASEFTSVNNRGQKVTAKGVKWNIRGTNIQSELREVPSDVLVLDERDVANEDNLDDAYARLDGSDYARVYELSTPTVDGHGVYGPDGWASTDQMRWWVACPHCSSYQVINFDENVMPFLGENVKQSQDACRCSHCKGVFTDADRAAMNATGKWVPDVPGADKRGYHLSQLNSPTKTLADPQLGILVNYFLGQTDARKLKAFYTLGLGLPYAAPGDQFTVELLDKCRRDYTLGGIPDGPVRIGIDVGHDLLYVTMYVRVQGMRKLWQVRIITAEGGMSKWDVLERDVLRAIPNWITVCDAHPDKEAVEALSKKYSGKFWMGFEKDRPEQPETAAFGTAKYAEPCKVNIDRTMAFDSLIKNYIDGNTILPRDARELGEYMPKLAFNSFYHHHLQMVRVEQADAQERIVSRWVNTKGSSGKKPDHFHHSDMFALVADMKDAPLDVPEETGALFAAAGGLIGVGA